MTTTNKGLLIVLGLIVGLFLGTIWVAQQAQASTPPATTAQGGTGTTSPSGILFGDNGVTPRLKTLTIGSNLTLTGSTLNASASGGGSYPFPLTGNATSTLTQFNGGLTAYASSTIGNGTNGLTISGDATTTGSGYFNTNLFVGTSTLYQGSSINRFAVTGDTSNTSGAVVIAPGLTGNNRTLTLTGNTINAAGTSNGSAQALLIQNNGAVVGIGTTTPFALLSVATKGDATGAVTTLFAVASSTNYASGAATSTLLALSNTGLLTFASSTNTSALTNPYPFTQGLLIPNKPDLVTNFENASMGWQGNVFYVQTQPGGTGSLRALTLQATNSTGGSPAFVTLSGTGVSPNIQIKSPIGTGATGNQITTSGPTGSSGNQVLTSINTSAIVQTGTASYSLLDVTSNEQTVGTGSHYIQRWIASTTAVNGLQGTIVEGVFTSAGQLGIGSTSPFARLSVHANSNDTTSPILFAIGSSTASATTTLFNIDNTGTITTSLTGTQCVHEISGVLSGTGSDCAASFSYPFTYATTYNTLSAGTSTPLWLQGSPYSLFASSTSIIDYATSTAHTITGALYIPNASVPALGTTAGRVALNTSAASTSVQFYGNSTQNGLYNLTPRGVSFVNPAGYSGTTTIAVPSGPRGTTLTQGYCQSAGGGSFTGVFGKGTATSTYMQSSNSGSNPTVTTISSNNTLEAFQTYYVQVGSWSQTTATTTGSCVWSGYYTY